MCPDSMTFAFANTDRNFPHHCAASKSFSERDSAIVVSQMELRFPMSALQKEKIIIETLFVHFSRKCIRKVTRKMN